MGRYFGIDRQEIALAATIGYGTVLATALTVAFIVGATDGHQGSVVSRLGGGLSVIVIGLPVIVISATVIAIVLSVPATLVWTWTTSFLRRLGYSSRNSALTAMAITTILASSGILAYEARDFSTFKTLIYLVVPLVFSVSISLRAFKEQKSSLAVGEK